MSEKTKVRKVRAPKLSDGGTPSLHGTIIKIVLLGIIDAVSLFATMALIGVANYLMAGLVVVVTLLLNYIYLRRGGLPAKYLAPGLVFMAIFQFYVVGFSGYIAFTNYGGGHILDKQGAITAIKLNSAEQVPDAATLPVSVVVDGNNEAYLLITEPAAIEGEAPVALLGNTTHQLADVTSSAVLDGDKYVSASGYTPLKFVDVGARQNEILAIQAMKSDGSGFFYKTPDASVVTLYKSSLIVDQVKDTVTRVKDNKVFTDQGKGAYQSADGEQLLPGWRADVGFENFVRAVTNERIRGPLLMVAGWTFAFAGITVLVCFAMGLGLALLFNDDKIKFKRTYRIAMILPYAFPGFLSALIWQSMFNTKEGFINQAILGGLAVPWLQDPFLAKVAVLLVNFWLGFPYMFLITTGALQAIPAELSESAKIDGATPWQQFRYIKLPLLLVSVSPLLITSFAYNFNNFTLIYLVTGGGPKVIEADMNVGHTDILITLVYKIAFNTGKGADYGLASAFSILIFLVVGTISYLGFRRTKTLEDQS